jgi:hypothetical protein
MGDTETYKSGNQPADVAKFKKVQPTVEKPQVQKGGPLLGVTIAHMDEAVIACSRVAKGVEDSLGKKIPADCETARLLKLAEKPNQIKAAQYSKYSGVL